MDARGSEPVLTNVVDRDITELLNKTHHSTEKYTLQTPVETLFASNGSCVLSPEVTEGPYYVAGEFIRDNIVEKEPGVNLALDLQVLDVATCDPVADKYLEIWRESQPLCQLASLQTNTRPDCNSTGVYGGVAAAGNGNGDASNLNSTWLRGVLKTDKDGVAQFHTLFPGHYTGRATHIHVMVHQNATAYPNGTLFGTQAAHVGQVYFDQDLITEVEKLPVYAANKQPLTTNAQDFLLAQGAASGDPIVNYVLLGDKIQDGLLGWIAFGVNTTLSRTVSPGATYYESGGKQSPGGGFPGGGPGGPPPPGGFPSGFPSGFPGPRPTGAP
ncbi:Intradiol ring-cleavage dioxygenase [Cercophora newfieldiana]|uniref:Intradiol ring-cleavage dioxygenase n=1 Tax=Cercophora newfieldiana TaxID=92897 RepID=A0AA39Y3S1_9PEZI|nr:Intradiol ring-cleavage dioxygenase [Cercophora newfieldiana]